MEKKLLATQISKPKFKTHIVNSLWTNTQTFGCYIQKKPTQKTASERKQQQFRAFDEKKIDD